MGWGMCRIRYKCSQSVRTGRLVKHSLAVALSRLDSGVEGQEAVAQIDLCTPFVSTSPEPGAHHTNKNRALRPAFSLPTDHLPAKQEVLVCV